MIRRRALLCGAAAPLVGLAAYAEAGPVTLVVPFHAGGSVFAPRGAPETVLERLNLALREALAAPELAPRFAPQGVTFVPGPREGRTGLRAES